MRFCCFVELDSLDHSVGRWYSGRVSQTFQNRIDAVVKSYGAIQSVWVSEWVKKRGIFWGVAWDVRLVCVWVCSVVGGRIVYVSIYSPKKLVLCGIRKISIVACGTRRSVSFINVSSLAQAFLLRLRECVHCSLHAYDVDDTSLSLIWNMVHLREFLFDGCHPQYWTPAKN